MVQHLLTSRLSSWWLHIHPWRDPGVRWLILCTEVWKEVWIITISGSIWNQFGTLFNCFILPWGHWNKGWDVWGGSSGSDCTVIRDSWWLDETRSSYPRINLCKETVTDTVQLMSHVWFGCRSAALRVLFDCSVFLQFLLLDQWYLSRLPFLSADNASSTEEDKHTFI